MYDMSHMYDVLRSKHAPSADIGTFSRDFRFQIPPLLLRVGLADERRDWDYD